jgi:hypothetical protein
MDSGGGVHGEEERVSEREEMVLCCVVCMCVKRE